MDREKLMKFTPATTSSLPYPQAGGLAWASGSTKWYAPDRKGPFLEFNPTKSC